MKKRQIELGGRGRWLPRLGDGPSAMSIIQKNLNLKLKGNLNFIQNKKIFLHNLVKN
jgi:hypothetical protein